MFKYNVYKLQNSSNNNNNYMNKITSEIEIHKQENLIFFYLNY